MFQLRDDHVRALQAVASNEFVERGVAHLRTCLPAATAGFTDDQLRQRIRGCIGRAGKYGLSSQQQVITFVDATYLAGEDFDTAPGNEKARALLLDPDVTPDGKARCLLVMIRCKEGALVPSARQL